MITTLLIGIGITISAIVVIRCFHLISSISPETEVNIENYILLASLLVHTYLFRDELLLIWEELANWERSLDVLLEIPLLGDLVETLISLLMETWVNRWGIAIFLCKRSGGVN